MNIIWQSTKKTSQSSTVPAGGTQQVGTKWVSAEHALDGEAHLASQITR